MQSLLVLDLAGHGFQSHHPSTGRQSRSQTLSCVRSASSACSGSASLSLNSRGQVLAAVTGLLVLTGRVFFVVFCFSFGLSASHFTVESCAPVGLCSGFVLCSSFVLFCVSMNCIPQVISRVLFSRAFLLSSVSRVSFPLSLLAFVACRLREKSPAQSRSSCSPYRTSSRCGSAPPGDSKLHSRSCSCSASWRMDEDRQEEQSSLDFVSVVAHMRSVSELLEAPSENRRSTVFG